MKKTLVSCVFIVFFAFYVWTQKLGQAASSSAPNISYHPVQPITKSEDTTLPETNPSSTASTSTTTNISTPKPAGLYKDGTYTGNVANAYYGNVQVKVTAQDGKITDVQFLDYPSDRSTSRMISSYAMPYLKQEAINAQSAKVDGVSGATFTSQAFIKSLSSALEKAKNQL